MSIVSFANSKWEDITTVSIEGTGLFDNLMYVVKQHLLEEYNAQRIRGADYTKAYIESIQAVLANTTQYIATTALNDLLRQKLEVEIENLELERAKISAEINLLESQYFQSQAEINRITYETNYILVSQYNLTNARVASEKLQPSLINKQISLLDKQIWGFEREAEYKIAKLQADIWSVARGTDDTFPFSGAFDEDKFQKTWSTVYTRLDIPW